MSKSNDTTSTLFAMLNAMAPKVDMPNVVNQWTKYYKNPTDYKVLGAATHASFLSPFESTMEFAAQVLTTAAVNTFLSLATMILAAASVYYLVQAVKELMSQNKDRGNQALNQFKACAMTAASAYIANVASAFIMPVLMTSLVLRSAVTLYNNQSTLAGFFNSKTNPLNSVAEQVPNYTAATATL